MSTEAASRRQLERAVLFLAFLLPFDIIPFVAGRPITAPVVLAVGVMWAVHNVRHGSQSPLPSGTLALVYCWLAWCVCTALWSPALSVTALAAVSLLAQILMMLALIEVLPAIRERVAARFAAGSALLACWALVTPVSADEFGRVSVGGIDQNVTGLVLTVGVACSVSLFVFSTTSRSLFPIIATVLSVAGAIKVGSRTGIVAILLILAVTLLCAAARSVYGQNFRATIRSVMALAALVILYSVMATKGWVPDRVAEFLLSPDSARDSGREDIIGSYLRFQADWWVRGVGYGADNLYLADRGAGYQNAHSLFWKTWIETGIIGLILLGSIILRGIACAFRRPLNVIGIIMASPIVVYALTLGGDRTSVFWFVLAIMLSAVSGQSNSAVRTSPLVRRRRSR